MSENHGQRDIGSVTFTWWFSGSADDRVEVTWLGSLIVDESLPLPGNENPLVFSAYNPGNPKQRIAGELRFDFDPASLVVVYLRQPNHRPVEDVVLFSPGPPVPVVPDNQPPPEVDVLVDRPPESDLFPYLYLDQWPGITDAELNDRFVRYDATTATKGSLYQNLLSARSKGRNAMLEQVDLFLEEKKPYIGAYLRNLAALGPPMDALSQLDGVISPEAAI